MENEILKQRLAEALGLAKQGAYSEARTALETLCEEASDSAEAFYYLGLACKRTQDNESARAAWEKCLALDPFQHQARTQLNSLSKPAEEDFLTDRGSSSALFGQPPEIPRVQPAPLGARSLAFLIDSLLFNFASAPFIALFVLYLLGSAEIEGDPFDWVYENRTQFQWGTSAVSFMVHLVFIPFYYYESGMTPGKRLLGMRIVDVSTLEPLSMAQCMGRFLASFLSSCALYLGYLLGFFNQDRRTLHDYLAGTFVASSETAPMSIAEKFMTFFLLLFAVIGLGLTVIGLILIMGSLVELMQGPSLFPF